MHSCLITISEIFWPVENTLFISKSKISSKLKTEQNQNQDINLSILFADIIAGAAAGGIVVLILVVLIIIIIIMNRFVYNTIINGKYELVNIYASTNGICYLSMKTYNKKNNSFCQNFHYPCLLMLYSKKFCPTIFKTKEQNRV